MKILPQENLNITSLTQALRDGSTLVYPTETCYGLGCDATNLEAVEKIFNIKQRQKDKPVLVLMADIAMAMEYIEWDETIQSLADKYWPGPLTIVARKKQKDMFASGVVGPRGMVAFRVTSHPVAQEIVSTLGKPLVSTSANIASHESPYDIDDVLRMFEGQPYQPDIVIDAGQLRHKAPSTIVKILENGTVEVLREGEVVISPLISGK